MQPTTHGERIDQLVRRFVAMIAYKPGVPIAHEPQPTGLSLTPQAEPAA